jgi:hypothetical protein
MAASGGEVSFHGVSLVEVYFGAVGCSFQLRGIARLPVFVLAHWWSVVAG